MTDDEIRLLSDIFSGKETNVPASITEVPVIGGLSVSQQKMRDTLREREEMRELARQKELSDRPLMEKAKGVAEAGQFLGSTIGRSMLMPFAELGGRAFGQEGMGERLMEAAPLPKSDLGLEYTVKAAEALEPVGKAFEASKLPPVPFLPELLPLHSLPAASSAAIKKATEATAEAAKGVSKAVKTELKTAPVGAIQIQQPAAPRSDLGLYSNAEQAVLNLKQNRGTGNQLLAQISNTPGVKPAELEWTGLTEFLKAKGDQPVTKAEIADYLATNKVQVFEKQLLDEADFERRFNEALPPSDFFVRVDSHGKLAFFVDVNGRDQFVDMSDLPDYIFNAADNFYKTHGIAKFGPSGEFDATLPGGENYREILLMLPEAKGTSSQEIAQQMFGKNFEDLELRDRMDVRDKWQEFKNQRFRSTHFDEPNIVAHIRVDDRIDADGKKVLFVEELQSDWGQKARDKGFLAPGRDWNDPEYQAARARSLELNNEFNRNNANPARQAEIRPLMEEARRIEQSFQGKSGVPSAPFVKNTEDWLNLSLKRLITDAVNRGYDKVAFINGAQSADRYDLSKDVQRIAWVSFNDDPLIRTSGKDVTINLNGREDLYLTIDNDGKIRNVPDGSKEAKDKFIGKGLDEVIGKDLAQKIISEQAGGISGDGLKIGGEGMKKFYDQIVPNTVNKLLKKLGGGKLEPVNIASGSDKSFGVSFDSASQKWEANLDNQPLGFFDTKEEARAAAKAAYDKEQIQQLGFTITPEMRDLVKGGLPLFAKGGRVLSFAKGGEGDVDEFNRMLKKQDDEARLDSYVKQLNEEMEKTISDFQFGRASIEDIQRFFPGQSQWDLFRRFGNTDERTLKTFPSAPPSFKRLEEIEPSTESINEFGTDGRYRLEDELQARYGGSVNMKKGGSPLDALIQAGKKAKAASDAKRREQRVQQNLEKYMGTKDKPQTFYHATQAKDDFSVFDLEKRPDERSAKAVFVSPSPQWASDWIDTDMKLLEKTGIPKPRVMPVITRAKNPFDYENPTHVQDVVKRVPLPKAFSPEYVAEQIGVGNWNFIEDRRVQQAIKDLGFDSFYVQERGVKNLGIFDPSDVKSLFNRGSYDPTTPDISKRKGGLACL